MAIKKKTIYKKKKIPGFPLRYMDPHQRLMGSILGWHTSSIQALWKSISQCFCKPADKPANLHGSDLLQHVLQTVGKDWDLGNLEAWSTPWALYCVPRAVPEQCLLCVRAHGPAGGPLPSGSVAVMGGCTWSTTMFGFASSQNPCGTCIARLWNCTCKKVHTSNDLSVAH